MKKLTRKDIRQIINEQAGISTDSRSLRAQAERDFASLKQSDVELINNYMTQISPDLDLNSIFKPRVFEFIDSDKETVERFEEARPQISEFLKMLTGNESQRITDYIESILTTYRPGKRFGPSLPDRNAVRTFYKRGVKHRDGDLPAEIHYGSDGQPRMERWFKNGKRHREGDKPAFIGRNKRYITAEYYYKDDVLHRDGDKPATITYAAKGIPRGREWFKNGLANREGDKPTSIMADIILGGDAAVIEYRKNNLLHREGGKPARIVLNTSGNIALEQYYEDDMFHREGDKPVSIKYNSDGSIDKDHKLRYFIKGKEYTPEEVMVQETKGVDVKKLSRAELRKIIAESFVISEAQENLPKTNQKRVRAAASSLEPAPEGRFSATLRADNAGAVVDVDEDSTLSGEHEEKLKNALRLDGVLGFRSGELDKEKTYKFIAVFG